MDLHKSMLTFSMCLTITNYLLYLSLINEHIIFHKVRRK